jgi:hypothetical protein
MEFLASASFHSRVIVAGFARSYQAVLRSLNERTRTASDAALYIRPATFPGGASASHSAGRLIVRAVGDVERLAHGLLANFWDHAAEWTMPEFLPTAAAIQSHIADTEALIVKLFQTLNDADLAKTVCLPDPRDVMIGDLALETLLAAHGRDIAAAWTLRLVMPRGGPDRTESFPRNFS